mmetsp:Transcript_30707/g.73674  ORF Transcript_30707/g.73674 Transcript_30707/m.73674 type:complete len:656 (+) Transcript_30707:192-2159(+)|eukprot:CAMPEP_0113627352 /NCGR_PEP_ID=MMETSP0017_2-20120614/14163_1 /TAXON_ID=2856 /ORGANISM="Cylindrotheca closterium" /LENGTH=655 /DNA_ID=CAMNT_0000537599 /DNA_START=124 /DNA_END=2091 /DNA_ORIENTATION=- /assembly_acc=CAM_ASM_000147
MADAARAQRQKALADKKKRLEELKARRLQRGTQTTRREAAKEQVETVKNLDAYIDGLLQVPAAGGAPAAPPPAQPAPATPAGNDGTNGETKQTPAQDEVEAAPAPVAPVIQVETFEMGTQTLDDDFPPSSDVDESEELQDEEEEPGNESIPDLQPMMEEEAEVIAKVLTAEEVEQELKTETFSSFLNIASKKVERVLNSSFLADLLVDYDGESNGKKRIRASDGSTFLTSRQVYECSPWTQNRDVTDMDWSPLHTELMLCSYHMSTTSPSLGQPKGATAVKNVSPDDSPSDSLAPRAGELMSDGLALVWNLAMPSRPEHIFTCGSPVTTTRFHPTESPLIIGGCQSGQVVVWDVRAGRMPVQKSSLVTTSSGNSKGHTHPICSMQIVEGNTGLVTAATDGRVNFWSLANLRDPLESLQVGDSVSSLAVSPETDTLVCGDEMGNLYSISSSQSAIGGGSSQRSRRQMRKIEAGKSENHFGLITSVSTKKLKAPARAGIQKGFLRGSGGLFLTSGVDWTVKMWSPAYTDKPLLSLVSHSYDYMSDVQWSPTHPGLMATASSNGTIGLWNFALSLEEPITGSDGIVVEPDGGSGRGLNKLKWSSDGRRMLVASADRVHALVLAEDVVRQKGDEDSRMMNHLLSRGLLDRTYNPEPSLM